MGEKNIYIGSVNYSDCSYSVEISLNETRQEEGKTVYAPLGGAVITFPSDTPMEDIIKQVVKAAQGIFKAHQDAKDKKADLEQVDWPVIE